MVVFTLIALLLFQMKAAEHKVVSIKSLRELWTEFSSWVKWNAKFYKTHKLKANVSLNTLSLMKYFYYAGGRHTDGNSLWGVLHLLVGDVGSNVVPVLRLQCTHHKHPAVINAGRDTLKRYFKLHVFWVKKQSKLLIGSSVYFIIFFLKITIRNHIYIHVCQCIKGYGF